MCLRNIFDQEGSVCIADRVIPTKQGYDGFEEILIKLISKLSLLPHDE